MYALIEKLESLDLFDRMVSEGIVPQSVHDHKITYENFLKHRTAGLNTVRAVDAVSLETGKPESTIYKILRKMKG